MIRIAKTREIVSPIERVWETVSNLQNEKRQWPVIRDIRVKSRNGNRIEREATIMRGPLKSVKSIQSLVLEPKRSVTLTMTKGPLIGTRKIILKALDDDKTRIDVTWEFELEGIPTFAESFVKNNISELTENALAEITKEAQAASPKS